MHFEILVEDRSGKNMLDILIPQLIGDKHTFNVYAYKGVGRIPKKMNANVDPSKRILLTNLPRLLRGYGKTFSSYPKNYPAAVFVICDLDDKCLRDFRNELFAILDDCEPKPVTRFCIAIEEGEAWLLGDIPAVKKAYPNAKEVVLQAYENDSICGTWECLADSVYPGGATALSTAGWQAAGAEKSKWAKEIPPHMRIDKNASPSFNYFIKKLKELL